MKRFILLLTCLALATGARAQETTDKPILVLNAGGHIADAKVLFTPDGKQLISVAWDEMIRFWDVATGEPLRILRPPIGPGTEGLLCAIALAHAEAGHLLLAPQRHGRPRSGQHRDVRG